MKTYRAIAVIMLVLGWTVAAHAAEIFSPVVSPGVTAGGLQMLVCGIVNVGNHSETVTIELLDASGTSADALTLTVAPGQAARLAFALAGVGYCKFTVEGSKNDFRASINILDPTTQQYVVAIPAY